MGKWDKLKGKFERKPFDEPKYQDKVDAARQLYASCTLKDLLLKFHELDQQIDKLEDEKKELGVDKTAIAKLIEQHFENMDVHSVQTDFGKTIYLQTDPSVSQEDKSQFETYVMSNADLDYLWSVNAQALKTFVKGLLEEGLDSQIPPGLRIYWDTQVRIKKT